MQLFIQLHLAFFLAQLLYEQIARDCKEIGLDRLGPYLSRSGPGTHERLRSDVLGLASLSRKIKCEAKNILRILLVQGAEVCHRTSCRLRLGWPPVKCIQGSRKSYIDFRAQTATKMLPIEN